MGQVFSQGQDPRYQVLTPEEVEYLIQDHDNSALKPGSQVTVQDLAETLGVPTSEVQQRVIHLRARPQSALPPMSSATWLKKRLWVWVLVAAIVWTTSGAIFKLGGRLKDFGANGGGIPKLSISKPNYKDTDGIYKHEKILLGRELGLESIPGFSYELITGGVDAAVNGDSKSYLPVEDLSPESRAVIQEQLTQKMLEGLDKAIGSKSPEWTNGEAVAVLKPNYYPGGDPVPLDLTLQKSQFPYRPASPEGKALHDKLLSEVKQNWDDILDN